MTSQEEFQEILRLVQLGYLAIPDLSKMECIGLEPQRKMRIHHREILEPTNVRGIDSGFLLPDMNYLGWDWGDVDTATIVFNEHGAECNFTMSRRDKILERGNPARFKRKHENL